MLSGTRSERRTLAAIVVMGLLIRGGICVVGFSNLDADPDAYRAIARTLAETGVYGLMDSEGQPRPTAFRPPLYPVLISCMVVDGKLPSAGVAILHTLLGALTVTLTYLARRRLLPGPALPRIVAAILVAVDPILLQQSTLVMTETLATTLATAIIWYWSAYRGAGPQKGSLTTVLGAIGLGSLFALAFLCRPTFLVWATIFVPAILFLKTDGRGFRFPSRRPIVTAASIVFLVAATIGIWTTRNARSVGHPVWATTHGGYTLLLGNNPHFYDYLREGEFGVAWEPRDFFVAYSHRYEGDSTTRDFWYVRRKSYANIRQTVSEQEDDRLTYSAARATIDRQPGMFAWSCLVRVARLWTPLPHRTADRSWIVVAPLAAYYVVFYIVMLAGIKRLGMSVLTDRWWPIWTLAITLTIVHAVYWSNMRMRSPVIPGMALIVAAAFWRPGESQLVQSGQDPLGHEDS